jgi:hypothetical protein
MGWNKHQYGDDFCLYCRRVVYGALFWIIAGLTASALAGTLLWLVLNVAWWIILCIVHFSIVEMWGEVGAGIVVVSVFSLIIFIFGLIEGWITMPKIKLPNSLSISCDRIPLCPESKEFLSHMWESFRDKVCFKMVSKND